MRITDANRRWWVLVTMTGSLSMILIDQTVVSVALPTMQDELGLSTTGVQWVVNAYLLAIAVLVALGGRIGDLIGNERVFRIGAIVFVLASAACGLAQNEAWIIVARAVEGAGAALMTPSSGAIVMNAFSSDERGKAMGIYTGVSMVFLALGPLIGGALVEGIGWEAVFYVNLPVGTAMLVLAHITMPRERAPAPAGGRVDWPGVPLLIVGVGALVLGLMQSRAWGWDSPAVISLLIAAAVVLPLFVLWELRAREPLVQLRLFKSRNFSADNLVLAVVQFGTIGVSVFGAIWVQDVLGFGPITAGLSLLPLTIPLLLLAPATGKLYDRIGPRAPVAAGAFLVGVAFAWSAAVLHELSYGWIVPGYVLMGIGLALVMTPASTDAMNVADPALRGQASGVIQTMRQVGGTIGIAVLGTIISNVQHTQVSDWVAADPSRAADISQIQTVLANPDADPSSAADPAVVEMLRDAVTTAISSAYWVAAGFLLAAAIVAALVLRHVRAADASADDVVPVV
ncbi:MAG TPA: DHA2 family efflux MFS transporter permease subunit [Capillimicrobium sp.]|nr:DHA2 family efflux MFS transporter permease subunit [Capillimicrobium sp.]